MRQPFDVRFRSWHPRPRDVRGQTSGPLVHLVEVGGRGGVFQHTLAVAHQLKQAGVPSVIHTSDDCEQVDDDIDYCFCFSWFRGKRARSARIAVRFLLRTVPHLIRKARGVIWVQGTFKVILTFAAISFFRLFGIPLIFSPHNLFSRRGSQLEYEVIRSCINLANLAVVYNASDATKLEGSRANVLKVALEMYAPVLKSETTSEWSSRLGNDKYVVASIGQIRGDKNIGLLIQACAAADVRLVVMGPDGGAAQGIKDTFPLESADVLWLEGYHDLEDLAAVTALCDIVALPYSLSSQSAAASLAKAYGTPVIAHSIGGLSEQADIMVDSLEVHDWSRMLIEQSSKKLQISKRVNEPGEMVPTRNALPDELARALNRLVH